MGKSDVKLHRFLSVPSNIALCERKEFSAVMTIDKDITLKPHDIGKIFKRQKSVVFQLRSSFSSGTVAEKLPQGLCFSLCTSDIDTHDIKANKTFTCNTSNSEMVRNMTELRDTRNRRTALGYIFEDTSLEQLDNLLSMYDNRTNSEITGDMQGNENHHNRRPALADIFQDLDEDDLEHLASLCEERDISDNEENELYEVTNYRRREALPDIFANINEEQLANFVQKCRQDIEAMESVEINEIKMPRRCQRSVETNTCTNTEVEDRQKMLPSHTGNINKDERNVCRRFALGNIFSDVSEDDLFRIVSMCEAEAGDEELESEETDEQTHVSERRFALADIFQDVSDDDLTKVLSDFCAKFSSGE